MSILFLQGDMKLRILVLPNLPMESLLLRFSDRSAKALAAAVLTSILLKTNMRLGRPSCCGLISSGHIEADGPGSHCSISLCTYSVGLLCFTHKPIPYEDSKLICLSTINTLLQLVYLFSGDLTFCT